MQKYGVSLSGAVIFSPETSLREIDIYFGKLMQKLSKNSAEEVYIASVLVSMVTGNGHVCLDLSLVAGKESTFPTKGNDHLTIKCPELNIWTDKLLSSNVVGRPGEYKPLILDNKNRLYLYRYWKYEYLLIQELKKRISNKRKLSKLGYIRKLFFSLFPQKDTSDSQMLSSLIALISPFCVISGGPGTGKTSIVAKILALLVAISEKTPKILLSAPTGKASARLKQAISKIKQQLSIDQGIKDIIPSEAYTIHRMLGYMPRSFRFRYNKDNRLPADVVVVDEASMIDLPLMSKLIAALPDDCELIILGDKDQLSSVEPGSVLGDICGDTNGISPLIKEFYKLLKDGKSDLFCPKKLNIRDCIAELDRSYRFSERSGIYQLSKAVNRGDKEKVRQILEYDRYDDVSFKKIVRIDQLKKNLERVVLNEYTRYLRLKDPYEAIMSFESFRILCPLRWGDYGVKRINRLVEEILQEHSFIHMDSPWYAGRPILIVENDYELGLFNGDVGILIPDPESNNEIRAFFVDPDGKIRKFLPIRLPKHETVFAMTVHKSQGSEFDRILFILPDTYFPIITKELIYTAITRARNFVEIWGKMEIIEKGVSQRIMRSSGLKDALWNENGDRQCDI